MTFTRHPANPIISRQDIPDIPPDLTDVSSVFNPGAVKFGDSYLLLLRVQNRGRESFMLKAVSEDGVSFKIDKKAVVFRGIETVRQTIYHMYDPRITRIDDTYYIMFAMDMEDGCRLGLAQTYNFEEYTFLGIVSDDDNRNGVLFPEKIADRYVRLERPNSFSSQENPLTGDTIFISYSDDLIKWGDRAPVFSGRWHYWDELIGAGPPPVKTEHGWLLIYHGIATHFASSRIYQAGAALLDLNDPGKVLSRTRCNILEPRELYETIGQVPNVVFPSGLIVDASGENNTAMAEDTVYLYYGAADTSVCLAASTVGQIIDVCNIR